jgi:hypothetical protein
MRFELFLTELPKASSTRVESELAELPKGTSTATILKAIETRTLPTVSVAWSDDKRVLNEIMDTLLELGAGCRLVDHGSLLQQLVTWSAEKLGRARYREDSDEGPRTYIKLGSGKENESWQEALLRHALTYLLELVLVAVLFVWFVALRVGFARIFAVPELIPQLCACALGLLAVYAGTESIRAVQTGRRTLKSVAPLLIAGACSTLASLFFLGDGFEKEAELTTSVKRPPSLPYAGLLTELRRRKLAEELHGQAGDTALELSAAAESGPAEEGELPWCDASSAPVADELQCRAGPAWEDVLACAAEPAPSVRPAATKTARRAVPAAPRATPEPAPLLLPAAPAPEPTWALKLELSTLIALIAMWLLSLGLVLSLRRDRLAARGAAPAQDLPARAPPAAQPGTSEAAFAALCAERDALRVQLVDAQEALASAQLSAGAARKPEDVPLASLQRELELTRSSLGANQTAYAQLKQQHAQASAAQATLSAELERLKHELAQTLGERDSARSALLDVGGRVLPKGSPANRVEEPERAPARAPTSADDSSYSVSQVQEERVLLPKRRR